MTAMGKSPSVIKGFTKPAPYLLMIAHMEPLQDRLMTPPRDRLMEPIDDRLMEPFGDHLMAPFQDRLKGAT